MDNVIEAEFSPEFKMHVYSYIKKHGIKRTEILLAEGGAHQSFIKAIIRNITRTMGW